MRCPKCQYLAFEASDRCRNCGYDFSLSVEAEPPPAELAIRSDHEVGPLADLVIRDRASETGNRSAGHEPARLPRIGPAVTSDLPLFTEAQSAREPELAPARPRQPLAVRRTTPEPVRVRSRPARVPRETPALDLEPSPPVASDPVEHGESEGESTRVGAGLKPAATTEIDEAIVRRASLLPRFFGGLIDAFVIGVVDVGVVYFTLQICGLQWFHVFTLPAMPLFGFFLVLNGGYLAAFTAASGQTVGKMIAGVRVVQQDGRPVGLGQAMLRTAAYAVSIVPFGLGFVPALIGPRLALHDRLAGTQVVKAA